jgi:hypothetical protein
MNSNPRETGKGKVEKPFKLQREMNGFHCCCHHPSSAINQPKAHGGVNSDGAASGSAFGNDQITVV